MVLLHLASDTLKALRGFDVHPAFEETELDIALLDNVALLLGETANEVLQPLQV